MSSQFIPKKKHEIEEEKDRFKNKKKNRIPITKNSVLNYLLKNKDGYFVLENEDYLFFTTRNKRLFISDEFTSFNGQWSTTITDKKLIPTIIINKKTGIFKLDEDDQPLSYLKDTPLNNSFPNNLSMNYSTTNHEHWLERLMPYFTNTLNYYNFNKTENEYYKGNLKVMISTMNSQFFVLDGLAIFNYPTHLNNLSLFIKDNYEHKTLEDMLNEIKE